ncbi:MAG: hypothetical protein ACPGVU_21070 [Limisphaerales bacterium]
MNPELKCAWYTVIVVGTATILSVAVGMTVGWSVALAPAGLLGLLGFTPVLFRKRKPADCDERDLEVIRQASIVGGACSYLAFVLGGMLIWTIHFSKGLSSVNIHILPGLVFGGAIVLYLARSLFIMSQYTPHAIGGDE